MKNFTLAQKIILVLALIGLVAVLYVLWRLAGGIGALIGAILVFLGIRKDSKKKIESKKILNYSKEIDEVIAQEKELQKKREEELKAKEKELKEFWEKGGKR